MFSMQRAASQRSTLANQAYTLSPGKSLTGPKSLAKSSASSSSSSSSQSRQVLGSGQSSASWFTSGLGTGLGSGLGSGNWQVGPSPGPSPVPSLSPGPVRGSSGSGQPISIEEPPQRRSSSHYSNASTGGIWIETPDSTPMGSTKGPGLGPAAQGQGLGANPATSSTSNFFTSLWMSLVGDRGSGSVGSGSVGSGSGSGSGNNDSGNNSSDGGKRLDTEGGKVVPPPVPHPHEQQGERETETEGGPLRPTPVPCATLPLFVTTTKASSQQQQQQQPAMSTEISTTTTTSTTSTGITTTTGTSGDDGGSGGLSVQPNPSPCAGAVSGPATGPAPGPGLGRDRDRPLSRERQQMLGPSTAPLVRYISPPSYPHSQSDRLGYTDGHNSVHSVASLGGSGGQYHIKTTAEKVAQEKIEAMKMFIRKFRFRYEVNPYRREDGEGFLRTRTHNRRRWSHIFPQGKLEHSGYFGLNWKSLSQPAILPSSTDFLVPLRELQDEDKFEIQGKNKTITLLMLITSNDKLIVSVV